MDVQTTALLREAPLETPELPLPRLGGVRLAPESAPAATVGGMPYAVAITLGTSLVMWLNHS